MFFIGLAVGLLLGSFIGILVMALVNISKEDGNR